MVSKKEKSQREFNMNSTKCTIQWNCGQQKRHAWPGSAVMFTGGHKKVIIRKRHNVERVIFPLDGLEKGGKQVTLRQAFVHLDFVSGNE